MIQNYLNRAAVLADFPNVDVWDMSTDPVTVGSTLSEGGKVWPILEATATSLALGRVPFSATPLDFADHEITVLTSAAFSLPECPQLAEVATAMSGLKAGDIAMLNTPRHVAGTARAEWIWLKTAGGVVSIGQRPEYYTPNLTPAEVTGTLADPFIWDFVSDAEAARESWQCLGNGIVDRYASVPPVGVIEQSQVVGLEAELAGIQLLDVPENDKSRVRIKEGTQSITSTLVITQSVILQGSGTSAPGGTSGTLLDNSTNDAVALHIDGSGGRIDRPILRDFQINHGAPTKYALHLQNSPFALLENIYIGCSNAGYGGIIFGDLEETSSNPIDQAYLSTVTHCRVWQPAAIGIRVNSPGTQWLFSNCHVGATADGAISGLFESEGVRVFMGQWGSSGANSIALSDYNRDTGERLGNVFEGQVFEGISATGKAVSFDGLTKAVVGGTVKDAHFNMSTCLGVGVYFGRAKRCIAQSIKVVNPDGGGTLAFWSADSRDCSLICGTSDAANAPVSVDGSAIRATKIVECRLPFSQVSSITTAANLRTILKGGVEELPNWFIPIHDGSAWNFQYIAAVDDTAYTVTPPAAFGKASIISDKNGLVTGDVYFDTAAGLTNVYGGSRFNSSTGVLTGESGINNNTTVSAHTDGQLYVEVRGGVQKLAILFYTV